MMRAGKHLDRLKCEKCKCKVFKIFQREDGMLEITCRNCSDIFLEVKKNE